ncbi:MAG TPA: flagellar hook-basal body complex protein, partial [Devosia sp.]|nr:flagellar hook-basal body complex protein [Devosia sp.]
LFEDYLMPLARDNSFTGSDQLVHFTQDWSTVHDMSEGAIEQTGDPLDVALMGDGFLTVETPAGPRYTRSGDLSVDAEGILVDLNGHPVLGSSGPIKFDDTDTDITIAGDGTVSSNNGDKGKLALAEFTDPQMLIREGDTYFSGPASTAPVTTRVMQGALERSNVSGVNELTAMIRVQRAYQSLASLMQKQDDLRSNAIQRLGDVRA